MAYGNTSVSSLLRAARAAQQKQYALEDSIAAYEYDLSPKTQADFEKYQAHLGKRITQYQGTDPLKALNYQKTITSANRSFTSSELSRATTQVLYGNMDNPSKLNLMTDLFRRAVANGDENLAQRIEGQAAQLQQIMNRSYGGGGYGRGYGGGTGSSDYKRGINNEVARLENDLKALRGGLKSGGNFTLGQVESTGDGRSYFGTAKGLIENIANAYKQGADNAPDEQTRQEFLEKYDAIVSGSKRYDVGFGTGDGKLKGLEEINKYIEGRSVGSNPTRTVVNADGTVGLAENPVATFGRYNRNQDGSIGFAQTRDLFLDDAYGRSLGEAKRRLESRGLKVNSEGGTLSFINPVTGQEIRGASVDQYGNVLYRGLDDNGNPIMKRFVTSEGKDEIVSQQEQEAILNNPDAVDQDRAVLNPEDTFKRDVGKYLRKTAAAKMVDDVRKGVGSLGQSWGDFTKEFGGIFNLNPFAQGDAIKKLQGKYDVLKQAKELEKRNQEIAFQRANEEANRFLQQQRAAEEARRARSVVFSRPQPNFNALPSLPGNQPDARSIAVVRNFMEQGSPFGGPNPYRI